MTLATPTNRERVYRALVRLGFGGSSVSEIASEAALSCEVVTACVARLLDSGAVEVAKHCGNHRLWRPRSLARQGLARMGGR